MSQDLTQERPSATSADHVPHQAGPADYVLDPLNLKAMNEHLQKLRWVPAGPVVSAERIGDGNMNMTVRAHSERSSYILKQARPWVVKYPHIPAPVERAEVEGAFYSAITSIPEVAERMPKLLGFDPGAHLLWLEDLGDRGDLTSLYRTGGLSGDDCTILTDYLVALHRTTVPETFRPTFVNRAMRALNHEHQYDYPLRANNGLDLDRITFGLTAQAEILKEDTRYREQVARLGRIYLGEGPVLVHGDFFPGSWLRSSHGLAIIDPEFCFLGAVEYDVGVFLAHLELTGARAHWALVKERYAGDADWALAGAFAGAEIMRRLIGVAQLPLAVDLGQKIAWLERSRELVCAF